MTDKHRGFTIVNILVSFLLIIAIVLIGIFFIRNISLSKKISNTINQHESVYRLIVAYNFMCKTNPTNVLTFKTCASNSSECKNGKIITPGVTKISCGSKSANATNATSYFLMHFNENGYINYYKKKGLKSFETNQCCALENSYPKKGQTNIYGDNKNNSITIITNIGSKLSKDVYLTNVIDWPGTGFK